MKVIVTVVTCACFVYASNIINAKMINGSFVVLNHNTNDTCDENSVCVRKCCPQGMVIKNRTCSPSNLEFSFAVYDGVQEVSEGNFTFDVLHGKTCKGGKINKVDSGTGEAMHYYVQRNGSLYCPQHTRERTLLHKEYCLDNIVLPTHIEFVGLICFRASDYLQAEDYSGDYVEDATELCESWERVDISDGVKNRGDIIKDDVRYTTKDYFQENGTTWGCICHATKCIRKCCDANKKVTNGTCVSNPRNNFQLTLYENVTVAASVSLSDFKVVFGAQCAEGHVRILPDPGSRIYVQTDGSLYVQSFDYTYDYASYCVDVFEDGEISALLCERYETGPAEFQRTIYAKGKKHA